MVTTRSWAGESHWFSQTEHPPEESKLPEAARHSGTHTSTRPRHDTGKHHPARSKPIHQPARDGIHCRIAHCKNVRQVCITAVVEMKVLLKDWLEYGNNLAIEIVENDGEKNQP